MTTGEWSCLISFAWDPLSCSEQAGIEKFNENTCLQRNSNPRHAMPQPGYSNTHVTICIINLTRVVTLRVH